MSNVDFLFLYIYIYYYSTILFLFVYIIRIKTDIIDIKYRFKLKISKLYKNKPTPTRHSSTYCDTKKGLMYIKPLFLRNTI